MKLLGRCALLALCLALFIQTASRPAPPRAPLQEGQAFVPGCTLPFDAIKLEHPIDHQCPLSGDEGTDGNAPHHLQNEAKNDFCATNATVPVSYNVFVALQTAVNKMKGLPWGEGDKLPPDRSKLHDLKLTVAGSSLTVGEGTKVSFVGYVMEAQHDDVEKGEDVNCKISGNEFNDIHISLSAAPVPAGQLSDAARCKAITAEISPHFRPATWDKFDEAANTKLFKTRPVRLTGTLLFDAAHHPCTKGTPSPGNPVRISVWEIHPIYAIDVCKNTTLARCKATDDTAWTPFDQFKP